MLAEGLLKKRLGVLYFCIIVSILYPDLNLTEFLSQDVKIDVKRQSPCSWFSLWMFKAGRERTLKASRYVGFTSWIITNAGLKYDVLIHRFHGGFIRCYE